MRLLTLVLLLLVQQAFSQGIKGRVTNTNGEPIPYATLFVKEAMMGTTSNGEGFYELPLSAGVYHIQFRCMGYAPFDLHVEVGDTMLEKQILLDEQVFQLHEVRVFAGNENPAYPIMRRAISMAPYYRNQVKRYKAEVYIKGTAKLEKFPKLAQKALKIDLGGQKLKEGDVFVGENISVVDFEAPDVYKQKIISSNMSMLDDASQTFDVGLITTSIYEQDFGVLIMPLSLEAFKYYNFSYEGAFTEGKHLINMIRIIPKRKSKQLVSGMLYIIDGLWCVHRVELENKQAFGHIKTRIEYAELRDKVWLPVSHSIFIDGKMMGIKAKANYSSSVKYRSLTINDALQVPALIQQFIDDQDDLDELHEQELTTRQKKIDALLQKDDLNNRETVQLARLLDKEARGAAVENTGQSQLEVISTYQIERDDSATLRDEKYWESLRPNPLTADEKQSLQLAGANQASDTVSVSPRRPKLRPLGKSYLSFRNDSSRFFYNGLLNTRLLTFNPVEGMRYRQDFGYWHRLPNEKLLTSDLWLAYAFASSQFQWGYMGRWRYLPARLGYMKLEAGQSNSDYLGSDGIAPIINTVASLFFKTNFSRYQWQEYLTLYNQIEITNGFIFKTEIGYYHRINPEVVTQFSFFRNDRDYVPNQVFSFTGEALTPPESRTAMISLAFDYTPRRYYRMHQGRKIQLHSNWPTFTATYKKGVKGFLGSDSDWDYLDLQAVHRLKTGAYSQLYYHARAGVFLNNRHIAYPDYAGFFTASAHVKFNPQPNNFRILPSYQYHSKTRFAEAHITYTTPYLALKYLPFLSEMMWRENVHFNFLSVPGYPAFFEAGYSISEIIGTAEVGVFSGFDTNGHVKTSIRFTFRY